MKIWAAIVTGINELMAHKLRSLLTMMGVIFGIGSVVAMSSIGAGARQEALTQIKLMGVNVIQVNRRSLSGDLATEAQKKSPTGLTYGDALLIRRLYKQAKLVVPVCRVFGDTRTGREDGPGQGLRHHRRVPRGGTRERGRGSLHRRP